MATKKRAPKGQSAGCPKARRIAPRTQSHAATVAVERAAPAPRRFPVVGIGASAGGLEALERFFAHMAPDCGIAFVVVTHQHPGQTVCCRSCCASARGRLLEDILPKHTAFENFEVEHDFAGLGRKVLRLNARRLEQESGQPGIILLALQEVDAPRGGARRAESKQ